jgi:branched-chain amino acid aminotransferase
MTSVVYYNGKFVDEPQALLGIDNGGWLHGAGLFETMRAEHGRVFRLESHLARLRRSISSILMDVDDRALPSTEDFAELLTRNNLSAARIRLTVSAASMLEGQRANHSLLTICATASSLTAYPDAHYRQGITVVICPFRLSPTDPIAGHKTTSHLPRLLALRRARQANCMETLWFTTANRLAEGSISNVFIVHEKTLKTPPLDTPVLPGIARSVVMELAGEESMETQECPLTIDDLLDADEVFLTNAIMQIMPVARVEKHDIGSGGVGPVAKKLRAAYRERVKQECDES